MITIDLKDLMHRAFLAGFNASSRHYNAEYPFSGCDKQIPRETYETFAQAYEEILESVNAETEAQLMSEGHG